MLLGELQNRDSTGPEMVRLLLKKYGAQPNCKTREGKSPLMIGKGHYTHKPCQCCIVVTPISWYVLM